MQQLTEEQLMDTAAAIVNKVTAETLSEYATVKKAVGRLDAHKWQMFLDDVVILVFEILDRKFGHQPSSQDGGA